MAAVLNLLICLSFFSFNSLPSWWMVSSWTWPAKGSTLFLRRPSSPRTLLPPVLDNTSLHVFGITVSALLSCLHSLAPCLFSKKKVKMRATKMPIQDCKQKRQNPNRLLYKSNCQVIFSLYLGCAWGFGKGLTLHERGCNLILLLVCLPQER